MYKGFLQIYLKTIGIVYMFALPTYTLFFTTIHYSNYKDFTDRNLGLSPIYKPLSYKNNYI